MAFYKGFKFEVLGFKDLSKEHKNNILTPIT
jgi:hypothetical protein